MEEQKKFNAEVKINIEIDAINEEIAEREIEETLKGLSEMVPFTYKFNIERVVK